MEIGPLPQGGPTFFCCNSADAWPGVLPHEQTQISRPVTYGSEVLILAHLLGTCKLFLVDDCACYHRAVILLCVFNINDDV